MSIRSRDWNLIRSLESENLLVADPTLPGEVCSELDEDRAAGVGVEEVVAATEVQQYNYSQQSFIQMRARFELEMVPSETNVWSSDQGDQLSWREHRYKVLQIRVHGKHSMQS